MLLEAPEVLPDLNVDEGRMMQVFGNLLSNALRYTPAGGSIEVPFLVTRSLTGIDGDGGGWC